MAGSRSGAAPRACGLAGFLRRRGCRAGTLPGLLALLLLAAAPAGAQPVTPLTVYYSASLDGCSCERTPAGGLVKRAAYLREQPRSGSLLLDAGDILGEHPDPTLARDILEVYRELGYQAVAAGEQELAAGVDALRGYMERFPLLAHNLPALSSTPAPPLIVAAGGLRVGILALLDPAVLAGRPESRALRVDPPEAAARPLLRACRELGVDLTVLLYHGPERGLLELIRACPDLDLVIFGHEGRLVPPRRIGSTVVASPGAAGNHLGILRLTVGAEGIAGFHNQFRFFSYRDDPDDTAVRARIREYREALGGRPRG